MSLCIWGLRSTDRVHQRMEKAHLPLVRGLLRMRTLFQPCMSSYIHPLILCYHHHTLPDLCASYLRILPNTLRVPEKCKTNRTRSGRSCCSHRTTRHWNHRTPRLPQATHLHIQGCTLTHHTESLNTSIQSLSHIRHCIRLDQDHFRHHTSHSLPRCRRRNP